MGQLTYTLGFGRWCIADWISVGLFTLAQQCKGFFFPGMGVDHPIPNFFVVVIFILINF